MTNSRKSKKLKNTLHIGTLIFQALKDVEKGSKMSFLNENVEFQWVFGCLQDMRGQPESYAIWAFEKSKRVRILKWIQFGPSRSVILSNTP